MAGRKPGFRWDLSRLLGAGEGGAAERGIGRRVALRGQLVRLASDERGLASVEYVVIFAAVTLGAALILAGLGPTLIRSFEWQVAVLGLPVP